MKSINDELVEVLGADFNWAQYIASIAANRASRFTKSAIMEDIVTDVTGDIIIEAKDGTLAVAIAKAKEGATTDAELLHNVKGVVMQATKFRVSDAVRWKYRQTVVQFSQIERVDTLAGRNREKQRIGSVPAREESSPESYKPLLVNELGLMAQAAEWKHQTKLVRRLRLAAAIVPDRVDGWTLEDLMEKYGVKSSSTMNAILDDIGIALARVAARLQDPTLLRGVAGVEVG